jgi:uncharacterized HhH-GPD family protein
MAGAPAIPITGDRDADLLIQRNPLALLIGMLLDQQVPMEWAFRGPSTLQERLGHLDASRIANVDPAMFEALCCEKPAIHRFPRAMAQRIQALCAIVAEEYRNDASRIWKRVDDANVIKQRLSALPGYGDEKASIFMAILGKRLGITPNGWKACAAPFSDAQPRSVADVSSPEALLDVRAFKKAQKAAGKGKADAAVDVKKRK